MSIIFKWNEDRAVIGHYKLPFRVHWQVLGLLDWMMSEMDGLEIFSEHKHNEQAEYIPVFMLTDRRLIGDLEQAFLIGADDYISKHSDLMQLGKIIKTK